MENVDITFIPSVLKRSYAGGFIFLKVFKYSMVYRQSFVLDPAVEQPERNYKQTKERTKNPRILKQLESWPSIFKTGKHVLV